MTLSLLITEWKRLSFLLKFPDRFRFKDNVKCILCKFGIDMNIIKKFIRPTKQSVKQKKLADFVELIPEKTPKTQQNKNSKQKKTETDKSDESQNENQDQNSDENQGENDGE